MALARTAAGARRSFFLRRLLVLPVSLFLVVTIAFLLVALIPQSTALQIAGPGATSQRVAEVQHQLGLDQPLLTQFGHYLTGLAHGNLGSSFYTGLPVTKEMLSLLPATLELVIPGFVLALLLGVTSGTLGAYFARRLPDRVVAAGVTVVQSIPEFVLALILVYVLFYKVGLFPAPIGQLGLGDTTPPTVTGFMTIDTLLAGDTSAFASACAHLALPVLTIGMVLAVAFSRITRASMGDALAGPYIEYARALGLPERQVLRYALVESRTPLLTYAAIFAATLAGGSAIVETVFDWHGLGQYGLDGMVQLDPPVIRGYVLLTATVTMIAFVVLDLATTLLDPRISLGKGTR